MKKTILCGELAVKEYVDGDIEKVKEYIKSGDARVLDITMSTTIESILDDIKGWFDFMLIMGRDAEDLLTFHYKLLKENTK